MSSPLSERWRLNGRPIVVADFGSSHPLASSRNAAAMPGNDVNEGKNQLSTVDGVATPPLKLRDNFPATGSNFEAGHSDGYCFSLAFRSSNASRNLEMITAFLRQHGYADIPLPATLQELKAFRLPRNQRRQLHLFADDGYVHNPIKILFPPPGSKHSELRLEIYNESAPNHLLRFHGRG